MTEWWPKWPKHCPQSTTQQIQNIQNVIPFVAITTDDVPHYHRWQISLEPAFASTTHKMQGTTAKFGAVIDPSEKKHSQKGWTTSQLYDQRN